MADKSVFGSTTRVFVLTPMTSLQSSTMSEADEDFAVLDSSAAATGDTFKEAAATEEGSAQPEGLRSAESPPPLGDPPGMKGPPGIHVKEEAKEDGSTVESAGVTNMTPPNGPTDDTDMKSHFEELQQQKKNLDALAKQAQDLRGALAKADEEKRQAHARAVAAEGTAARLHAAAAEAASGQVSLSPEEDSAGVTNMTLPNDHATRSEGCRWCASTWEDGIDLAHADWATIIWHASFKNASEIKTFDDDGVTPDWKSTATSGEGVAIDPEKFPKMLEGLCSSLGSRDAWCDNENGGRPSILNDYTEFQTGIKNFTFDPEVPDAPQKFMVTYWRKSADHVIFGCAHCFRGYNIPLPEAYSTGKGIRSNKQKKEWLGFKVVEFCLREDKATGRDRNWTPPQCGGAQASADKVRTPKAEPWRATKRSQQMDKGHGGQQSQQQGKWNWPQQSYGNNSGGSGDRSSGHDNGKPIAHQAYDNSNSHRPHSNGQQSQGAGSYRQQPHHQDRSWSDGDGRDFNNQYSRAKQCQDRRYSGQQSQQQENSYVGQQSQHQDKGGYQREHGYQQYHNVDQNRRVASHNDHGDRRDGRDHRMASRDNNSRGRGSSDHDHGSKGQVRMACSDSRRDDRMDSHGSRRDGRHVELHPRQDRRGIDSRDSRSSDSMDICRGDHTRSPRRQHDVNEDFLETMPRRMMISWILELLKNSSNNDVLKNGR